MRGGAPPLLRLGGWPLERSPLSRFSSGHGSERVRCSHGLLHKGLPQEGLLHKGPLQKSACFRTACFRKVHWNTPKCMKIQRSWICVPCHPTWKSHYRIKCQVAKCYCNVLYLPSFPVCDSHSISQIAGKRTAPLVQSTLHFASDKMSASGWRYKPVFL